MFTHYFKLIKILGISAFYHDSAAALIVDGEIINGQYQGLGNGLEVRFSGKDNSSSATAGLTPDEWEIEAWGRMESLDDNIGSIRSIKMTRGGIGRRGY